MLSRDSEAPVAASRSGRRFLPIFAGILAATLAVPIVPWLLWGEALDRPIREACEHAALPLLSATVVVAALASDIFLPIPSSVVNTLAGKSLGPALGAIAAWCGMTLGCVVAFALARRWGRPLAARWASEEELDRMDRLAERYGPILLAAARPLPVLAEASVLWFGTARLSWKRFLFCVGLSNLGIAVAYAWVGSALELPAALAVSLLLPAVAAVSVRVFRGRRNTR